MANRLGRRRRGCAATAPAVRLGGSSAAFGWSLLARAAVLLVAFGAPGCLGVLRRLGSTSDAVVASDIEAGGPCEGGCVRTVVDAKVYATGEVDCELRVENLLDHTDEDVVGGSLNVVHSCTNADGDLMYQGVGECLYSVCVTAEWTGELLQYSVVVEHEEPSAAHTVLVEVYMNEYQDLLDEPEVTVASTSSPRCELGSCANPSACPSGFPELVITTTDEYGDGWVGGLPDRMNTWTLTESSSSEVVVVAEGTLPDWHFSGITRLCLKEGDYSFETTAYTAWSSDSAWNVCEVDGGMGGSLEFEMSGTDCNVLDSSSKGGPPSTDVETSSGDMCTLPQDDECVGFDVGVAEVSGPSVGMYYDESCLEGGGGDTGCGGGGVTACRICFINREFWLADFADERYPDWLDCPCCVADALGVTCQGGGETGTASDESMLEKAEAFYWEGGTVLYASLGGLIGLGLITALCCCRDIRKTNQQALSYKHFRAAAVAHNHYKDEGDTSPDVSPPSGKNASAAPPAFPADDRERGLENAAAATAGVGTLAAKNKPSRGASRPGARREKSADARGRAAGPPDDFDDVELPGAARYQVPSDASWPSDPRVGVSVSGKKNPRWSGSRELNAYLRRTGYEEIDNNEGGDGGKQRGRQRSRSGSGGRGRAGGSSSVVEAIKRTGSMLSEKRNSNKFKRMEEGGGRDDRVGMEEIPLGDLPVSPSPPPAAQRSMIQSKPRSKSRSRSRSPHRRRGSKSSSHRRGGGGSGGSGGRTDGSGAAPIDGSLGVRRESSSKSSRLSGRGRPSRVAPTDEDSGPDEFGACDPSLLDRVAGAQPPEPRSRNVPKDVPKSAPRSGAERSGRGRDDKSRGRVRDDNGGGGRSRSRSRAAGLTEAASEGERARAEKASRRQQEEEERERKRAERSRALKEEQAEERRKARALEEKERAERKRAEKARALEEEERAEERRMAAKALEEEQAEERQRRQQERERRRVEEVRMRSAERERARSVGSRAKGGTSEREPSANRGDGDRRRDKKKADGSPAVSKQLQPPSYKESRGGRERGRQRTAADGATAGGGARSRSTPAGDGGVVPEPRRETEAERRRRRSREDKERRQAEAPPPPPLEEQEGRRSKNTDDKNRGGGRRREGTGGTAAPASTKRRSPSRSRPAAAAKPSAAPADGSTKRRSPSRSRPAAAAMPSAAPADGSTKRRSPSRSRPAAAAAAAAVRPSAAAKTGTSASTRFSNDPRAKKERAEKAKERRRAAANA